MSKMSMILVYFLLMSKEIGSKFLYTPGKYRVSGKKAPHVPEISLKVGILLKIQFKGVLFSQTPCSFILIKKSLKIKKKILCTSFISY